MQKKYDEECFTECYYKLAEKLSELVEGEQLNNHTITRMEETIKNYTKRYGDTFHIEILEDAIREKLEENSYSNILAFAMGGLSVTVGVITLIGSVLQNVIGLGMILGVMMLVVAAVSQIGYVSYKNSQLSKTRRAYILIQVAIKNMLKKEDH